MTAISDVTEIKYFSMEDAIKAPIASKTVFIIANERMTKSGHIGRYYTVFPCFKDFLKSRDKYKHCHEILVDHENNKPNPAGRLVFDFDIKLEDDLVIPKNFKKQIEDTIVDVMENYFNNVDANKFEFVWSTSSNPKKISKHLTVKNLYFDDWITMSKTFYQLFCIEWDGKNHWIKSNKLIDLQIVRKRGSLRMVGSTKIDGFPLLFDDDKHKLTDSLIRIYLKSQRETEQLVTRQNINEGVFDNVLCEEITETTGQLTTISFVPRAIEKQSYPKEIYNKAFEIYNTISPAVFKMGKINGNVLILIRNNKMSSHCIMSGKKHEHSDAFLTINKGETDYSIRFGCYRFCDKRRRSVFIASVSIDNMVVMMNTDLVVQPPVSKKKQKKKSRIIHL